MSTRLQSIRDRLQEAVDRTGNGTELGKLLRRALTEANVGLEESPLVSRPAVLIPTVYVEGMAYTADDVKDLLDALEFSANTFLDLANSGVYENRDICLKAYNKLIYTKEKNDALNRT